MRSSELNESEYHPYFKSYIENVSNVSLLEALEQGFRKSSEFFKNIPEEKVEYRYAEGKWTPKEILLHLVDAERVFCYRALQFSRSLNVSLEGFDENEFVNNSRANSRSLENILSEYNAVRKATIILFKSFENDVLKRCGKVNGTLVSIAAIGFILAGHEIHHRNILIERYL
jgi:hypothetical protein